MFPCGCFRLFILNGHQNRNTVNVRGKQLNVFLPASSPSVSSRDGIVPEGEGLCADLLCSRHNGCDGVTQGQGRPLSPLEPRPGHVRPLSKKRFAHKEQSSKPSLNRTLRFPYLHLVSLKLIYSSTERLVTLIQHTFLLTQNKKLTIACENCKQGRRNKLKLNCHIFQDISNYYSLQTSINVHYSIIP